LVKVLNFICADLPDNCHIEHILSHLGDIIALAERAKDTAYQVGSERLHKTKLQAVHHQIQAHIRDVLRWGYEPEGEDSAGKKIGERVGSQQEPIVRIDDHRRFVRALYRVGRAGVDAFREPIHFVTTNYDTLIEDALSLERLPYADGFTGGAVASWSEETFKAAQTDPKVRAIVTKLHGSIDWYRAVAEQGHIFRVRHDDLYPDKSADNGNVVIWPQSTKYMASRLDPFGCLFQHFRDLLGPKRQQVLFICGYSFGDDHINADIESLILSEQSTTTVVAFSKEPDAGMHPVLKRWCQSSAGPRIFVATEKGLYRGESGANFPPPTGEREWWKFSGVAQLLEEGLPADIAENIE
jgi:hypothetical protein